MTIPVSAARTGDGSTSVKGKLFPLTSFWSLCNCSSASNTNAGLNRKSALFLVKAPECCEITNTTGFGNH